MISAFHLGNIDFDFILGAVLVVLILITQVRMTIHAHLLKDDMGTDLAAGKIRKRTIHRVYFIKNTIIYNYTFEVEGIAYKGKYVESYRKMKKRGELSDEQRIKLLYGESENQLPRRYEIAFRLVKSAGYGDGACIDCMVSLDLNADTRGGLMKCAGERPQRS